MFRIQSWESREFWGFKEIIVEIFLELIKDINFQIQVGEILRKREKISIFEYIVLSRMSKNKFFFRDIVVKLQKMKGREDFEIIQRKGLFIKEC